MVVREPGKRSATGPIRSRRAPNAAAMSHEPCGQREDDASSFVDGFVQQVQVVGHDSIHHLLLAEVAQQQEIVSMRP